MRALLAYDGSEGSVLAADTMWSIAWPTETTIRVVAVLPSQLQAAGPLSSDRLTRRPQVSRKRSPLSFDPISPV